MTSKPSGSKLFFQHPKWKGKNQTIVNEYFSTDVTFSNLEKAIDVYNGGEYLHLLNVKILRLIMLGKR